MLSLKVHYNLSMCLSLTNDSYHISFIKFRKKIPVSDIYNYTAKLSYSNTVKLVFFSQIKESLVAWNLQYEWGWSWICYNTPASIFLVLESQMWVQVPDFLFLTDDSLIGNWLNDRLVGWLIDGYKLAHRDFLILLNWDFSSTLQPSY